MTSVLLIEGRDFIKFSSLQALLDFLEPDHNQDDIVGFGEDGEFYRFEVYGKQVHAESLQLSEQERDDLTKRCEAFATIVFPNECVYGTLEDRCRKIMKMLAAMY